MDTLASFFHENEQKTNILLIRGLFLAVCVFILFMAACIAGLFPGLRNDITIPLCLVEIVIILIMIPILRNRPNDRVLKYLIIFTICLLNLLMSFIPNTRMYISFLLPPLVSCFYINEGFTILASILSGITFEISVAIRAFLYDGAMFETISRENYFLSYGIGGLIEYTLYCYILFYLTRTTFQSLMHSFLRKKRLNQIHTLILDGFANIVESKDRNTAEHISRTSRYVGLICDRLKAKGMYTDQVNDATIPVMVRAAPFHDLGKINIPDDILNKPGKLDAEEWKIIQHHPADGALFIQHNFVVLNDEQFTKTASEMALCHHERVDGTGYPFKLVAEEIPISARIMAAADIFDALVSERAYKKPFTIDEAYDVLQSLSGKNLDPVIVDCMLEVRPEIEQAMKGSDA